MTTTAEPIESTEDEAPASTSPLAAACAAGTVKLYRERRTGTLRPLQYLTGEAREVAEWYRLRFEDGARINDLAIEAAVSGPTVRRAIKALDLIEAIEDGEYDDLWSEDLEALIFAAEDEADED